MERYRVDEFSFGAGRSFFGNGCELHDKLLVGRREHNGSGLREPYSAAKSGEDGGDEKASLKRPIHR
jgi:hypothetical protein